MRRWGVLLSAVLGTILAVLGLECARPARSSGGWATLSLSEMSVSQRTQWERAVAARDALFHRLMNRLQEAIEANGVASAIVVCQAETPRLARAVSEERGVAIGRTSRKLRNPNNRPPAWAETLVDSSRADETVLAHTDGRLGVLLPIRLKSRCLVCHGPTDAIPRDVREMLKAHYPQDAATGFAEGDLRGWFWVEVPPG